ncbi:MAG TPA: hypothetical protein PLE19_12170 [Planctomycetota bacterium]|nr:hypothetical protein [Planctomycetota bacterium]HRR80532.1 hypothetical protein [Planctomycetota bacterium]HRT94381.1 hypothetical protein [Planctomycetota bacterium]
MTRSLLAMPLVFGLAVPFATKGAEPLPAGPKGAAPVGTVSWRLGNRVAIAVAQGVTLQPNEELLVGRSRLLVTLAAQGKLLEAWGDWLPAGRIRLRAPRGTRHWIGCVLEDAAPPQSTEAASVPNVQPGDPVYRAAGASPSAPASQAPAPGKSKE